MNRRELITLLGGAAAVPFAGPRAARAQQPAMPRIGVINAGTLETSTSRVLAFRQGLNETGYVDGQNVTIEYHWAEGRYERYPELVADLIRRKASIIVTGASSPAALAAKAASATTPIVFGVGEDPVRLGLVASLARPGGNATGVNFFTGEVAAKRLGLLRELLPGATRIAVLVNPANRSTAQSTVKDVMAAGTALGLQIQIFNAGTIREIDTAYASLVRERADALVVAGDGFFNSRRVQLAMLAVRHAVPTTYPVREYTEAGGLSRATGPASPIPSARRHLWRPHSQGRETLRSAGAAIDQVRARHQYASSQDARPRGVADAARPRRRGDRMKSPRASMNRFHVPRRVADGGIAQQPCEAALELLARAERR